MLVGVTRDVAGHAWAIGYWLSDGRRQWLTALAVTERDGRMCVAYDDGPVPVIASLSVANGVSTVVGVLPGGHVAVNTTGTNPHHRWSWCADSAADINSAARMCRRERGLSNGDIRNLEQAVWMTLSGRRRWDRGLLRSSGSPFWVTSMAGVTWTLTRPRS